MMRFIKNTCYGFLHFAAPGGRDSRQTFCDICRACTLLALADLMCWLWRDTVLIADLLDWLVISPKTGGILCLFFALYLFLVFMSAVMRRWQDLDIRLPKGETFRQLLHRSKFWEILVSAEGSREPNQFGDAPADTPPSLLSEKDMKEAIRKELFLDDIEELK